MKKILVVSPHPDDAEIGLGASLYEWAKQGHKVVIAVCTGDGNLQMVHSGEVIPFSQREAEQKKAAEVLGIEGVSFLGFAPAAKFDTKPISELVSKFDGVFKHFDTVFLPLPSAAKDHQITWEAGLAAFRQGKLDAVSLFAYEQPMQHHGATLPTTGQVYNPVSSVAVEMKVQAIAQHASQFASRKGYGLYAPGSIKALAALRGAETGHPYAEMFYLIRGRYESLV